MFALLGSWCVIATAGAQPQAESGGPVDRFTEWMKAVETHEPGNPGQAALDVSTWTGTELEAVVGAARRHARAEAAGDPEQGNRLLLRGAELHADLARLIPDELTRRSPRQIRVYTVLDGRWQGWRYPSMHWMLGRSLLDAVMPAPALHPGVLAWYRDTSRDLLRQRALAEAEVHLDRARQLFPNDTVLLFYSGVLHERFSSSLMQAAAESLVQDNRGASSVSSSRGEVARAERFFRDALMLDPGHAEARVRHGSTLVRLGRHEEAVQELRRVLADGAADRLRYMAQLFLGRAYEGLANYDAARSAFEQAAALFPDAQSPRLALSYLARRTGDRRGAQRELQVLAKLPDGQQRREDPWWTYFDLQ